MPLHLLDTDKSISHLSVLWLSINQLLQITRKLSLSYTSKASHFHISQLLKGSSIGARHAGNEHGLCFTKWNLSGEHSPPFTVTSASHTKWTGVKALEEVSGLSTAFGLSPTWEMRDVHCSSVQLPWVLQWMCSNRCNRNKKVNVALA